MIQYIGKLFRYLSRLGYPQRDSKAYIKYLRSKGVLVGENVYFHQLNNVNIDTSRPYLVEIGNNVRFTSGLTLLTHDYSWFVLENLFGDSVGASGKVKIGNNIFIGFNVTILPGTVIGDNCIIGAGSIVKGNVKSGSVIAGNPARKICNINDFWEKRKSARDAEITEYVTLLLQNKSEKVSYSDLTEEIPLFAENNRNLREDIKKSPDSYTRRRFKNIEEFIKHYGR